MCRDTCISIAAAPARQSTAHQSLDLVGRLVELSELAPGDHAHHAALNRHSGRVLVQHAAHEEAPTMALDGAGKAVHVLAADMVGPIGDKKQKGKCINALPLSLSLCLLMLT